MAPPMINYREDGSTYELVEASDDGSRYELVQIRESDAELIGRVNDWLDQGQRDIDAALAAGAQFIINLTKVHTLNCPAVRDKLDLRTMHPFGPQATLDDLREHLQAFGWPRLPEFATEQEINAARRYTRCRRCCPGVLDKAPKAPLTTRAGNIGRSHIGRTADGRALEWVRLERDGVELGFDDGTVHAFDLDARIQFDPKSPGSHQPDFGSIH
ncbi:hypothetical protein [Rhodococcus tukisamuensis]|uniref:Uncharacterized protein n=1 Tax=Rhodococcus tukisamuensis TaxID=168276 RepID=A0A1G6T8F6_9NOCA|nr:hypothetical protein [Rhodococcus tukisamuensis]SDD25321.1 hypothetical protein SAMN05444580_103435 [Rhodococcus tukisamuensis]